ncbi:putative caffeoyl-CoA O-methyltransferase [Vitis vinifera]|uniref:Putative caffeoyl-CoA O-methyltransferase n=1 Tax=Vitis vinifera TaxID=29760 RepID=A0A438DRY7_VITVI|nr:putative caffeoyl-CoA O-methyltransferase [Vitis vinifera]
MKSVCFGGWQTGSGRERNRLEKVEGSAERKAFHALQIWQYILKTSVYRREPEPLKKLRALTAIHPWAAVATTPDSGQLLTMLLKLANTKKTIEIGVFTVYSLLLTALSIPDDGKPENEGCFDFAYVNSENYHERLMKLEKIDGVVVYDNVLRRGFVAMPEELLSGEKSDILKVCKFLCEVAGSILEMKGASTLLMSIRTKLIARTIGSTSLGPLLSHCDRKKTPEDPPGIIFIFLSPDLPSTSACYSSTTPIGIKLEGSNYALWSQVVEMYISGKDKLGYINEDSSQPPETDPSFKRWRTENAIVWDSAAITYFDLRRRVTRMKQAGGSIEKYYNDLQGLWREIDFRRPNPMECAIDIQKYNSILQEDRVYTFFDGLDDRLDKTRSDVLQIKPFPTVEQAYAFVRREEVRQTVMILGADTPPGAVMASKGIKGSHHQMPSKPGALFLSSGKSNSSFKTKPPSDGTKCTHCDNTKHTRDTCFKLHGYPDWWNDLQARKKWEIIANDNHTRRAVVVTCDASLSLIPQAESSHDSGTSSKAFHISTHKDDEDWILDSGATDHMTFDSKDFSNTT